MNVFTNIAGLGIGFASFLLICAYVNFERSYDRIHKNGADIFRVESRFYKGHELVNDWATSTNGYARAIRDNIPGVRSFTRLNWAGSERVIRNGNLKFREQHVCFADSNFFSFFSYPLLKGNPQTVLSEVNSIVISSSAAKKYFGQSNPVGRMLEISTQQDTYHCKVTGVFKDVPANSTMQFNFLLSWTTSPEWMHDFWYQHESYTFVQLQVGTSPAAVVAKFPAIAEKYKTGPSLKDLTWGIQLVPLTEIHLQPVKQYEIEVKGNRRMTDLLKILAFIILGIACINYINLTTARAIGRAKEVGVRKVSGATTLHLFVQFIIEAFLVNTFALVLAAILAGGVLFFLQFTATSSITPGLLFDSSLLLYSGVIFFFSILLSGVYPSLVLSRFKPISILKTRFSFSKSSVLLRQGLVVFQFAGSLILIAWTIGVYRQVRFMRHQNSGVNLSQTLVVKAPVNTNRYEQKIGSFKKDLKAVPTISGITGSGSVPGKEVAMFISNRKFGAPKTEERTYEMLKIDFDFIKMYGLNMIAGRDFDKSRPADSTGLLLNEAAVISFGFTSPMEAIGKKIWLETATSPNTVIGVVGNYHQQSLQQPYTPIILFMDPSFDWIPISYYSVKISPDNISATIDKVKSAWLALFPESSFDFFFLDDYYNRQYQQEILLGKMFLSFSLLTVFIACIGLFGLTAYSTARRTKEIGVRKVLGASVGKIISLLAMDAVRLILISSLVAIPLSFFLLKHWLQGYAFRINISGWQLFLPVILLLLIATGTIGYLTCRAALANPVKSLRAD